MARDDMKNGLPQGAVEIGTIAETEPGNNPHTITYFFYPLCYVAALTITHFLSNFPTFDWYSKF